MEAIASQITSLASVYSTVQLCADQRKHQSSASLAFVWGIHRGPGNSPHKWPVTRKMFPFDDVIMWCLWKALMFFITTPLSILMYTLLLNQLHHILISVICIIVLIQNKLGESPCLNHKCLIPRCPLLQIYIIIWFMSKNSAWETQWMMHLMANTFAVFLQGNAGSSTWVHNGNYPIILNGNSTFNLLATSSNY